MKVTLQRVTYADCIVDGKIISQIDKGYLVLVGFTHSDTIENVKKMAKKIVGLRIFEDECGKMNLSINDVKGEILSISQFTLYANPNDGNRPSFTDALEGSKSIVLYEKFNELLSLELPVKTGIFGAEMDINFTNNGPCTILLEY